MAKNEHLSRRETLGLIPTVLAIGAGLSATLVRAEARAAGPAYELRFAKKVGKKLVALDSIPLPAEVAEQIEAGNGDQLEFIWHVKRGDAKKKLAQHAATGRAAVAKKRPRKKT